VGTGFHPELTGRENTYLNGAILGMSRREIDRKFDEIIAFAEVERFVDTPVKHYSSGMYLRLAFAVAAHLEPEILIVDEVLAVGDASFQKKCLGKMSDVAHKGRTVLFVSHNMDAVQRLCHRCVLLERGTLIMDGETHPVISRYLSRSVGRSQPGVRIDVTSAHRTGTGEVRFESIQYSSKNDSLSGHLYSGGPLECWLEIQSATARPIASVAVSLLTRTGTRLINADTVSLGKVLQLRPGRNTILLRIEEIHLNPGMYIVALWLGDGMGIEFDYVESAFEVEIVPTGGEGLGIRPDDDGVVACRFDVQLCD
jgi:ABC-type multidrug transport system ATPase subunit